jgi:diguanylate cyclase (GGDEF)-like protein
MPNMRLIWAVPVVAMLAGLPAGNAHAVVDTTDLIRDLATEAAGQVAEERALVNVADPAVTDSPTKLALALTALALTDAHGSRLLARLDTLGVRLTLAARTALEPLPPGADGTPAGTFGTSERYATVPSEVVYQAAVADLLRIAATPEAVSPAGSRESDLSLGWLPLVALLLTAVGLTALLFTLRNSRPRPRRGDLQALAFSDALTGLANRHRLDHDIEWLASGATPGRGRLAPDRPTAVIMVDIDHFKAINDRHGHKFGDEVLRAVGTMLAREVRGDDVVYRYGGEEFCILLPGASNEAGERVAQRIVDAARRLELPAGVRVTVSAGVAQGVAAELDRTLQAADQALFVAKRGGRDRAAGALAAVG